MFFIATLALFQSGTLTQAIHKTMSKADFRMMHPSYYTPFILSFSNSKEVLLLAFQNKGFCKGIFFAKPNICFAQEKSCKRNRPQNLEIDTRCSINFKGGREGKESVIQQKWRIIDNLDKQPPNKVTVCICRRQYQKVYSNFIRKVYRFVPDSLTSVQITDEITIGIRPILASNLDRDGLEIEGLTP